jgi:glycosyltransferase involved in cell wall biosynthesis
MSVVSKVNRARVAELPVIPAGKVGWPWSVESSPCQGGLPNASEWPKISIVTPSFNQAEFLEETIRSVLLQNYPNLEYFVIDGGSRDRSVEIIKKYEPWLTGWVSEKDRGQSHAINKGFALCTGELMTFQNSDDFYFPGAFHDAAALWSKDKNAGIVAGGFHYVDGFRVRDNLVPALLPHPGPIDLVITREQWRLHQVSVFYSRRALDCVGRSVREDLNYTMDREILYRVCRKYKALLSQRAYGAFRWHPAGKSVSNFLKADMEYADLHLSYHYEDPEKEKLKRTVANKRRAKGYHRFARSGGSIFRAAGALINALRYDPALATNPSYYGTWLRVLRLRSFAGSSLTAPAQFPCSSSTPRI